MQCSNAVTDEEPSDCDCLPSEAQLLADALEEVIKVKRAGRDAFHRTVTWPELYTRL